MTGNGIAGCTMFLARQELTFLVFVAQSLSGHPVHEMQSSADRAGHRIIVCLILAHSSVLSNPMLDVHAGARAAEKDVGHKL